VIAPLLTLSLILLLALFALLCVVTFLMARMLLTPPRMGDPKAAYLLKRLSPGDLGLHFQATEFPVRDEHNPQGPALKIAAWWIPHPAAMGKCVVLIHGYGDAKVGAIAWAPMWHALGYHILAIDLRAHGESDGTQTTAGFFERHDLNQALDQLRAARPADTRRLVLFGVSLGAAVALAAADSRDDIAAMILECPYTQYSHAVLAHARVQNMPATFLVPLVLPLAQKLSGANFDVVKPIDLIPRAKCPILLISATDDPFAPPEDLLALERAIADRHDPSSAFWKVFAGHVQSMTPDPDSYRGRVQEFLASIASVRVDS
jgi:pimeloyl-ACP methyl ester carboxylesterase